MPEGPELHLAGRFVNKICQNRIFTGKVIKSAVSTKNPDVDWDEKSYTISATSRGKEVKLTLTSVEKTADAKNAPSTKDQKKSLPKKALDIVFRFGMSGKFAFDSVKEMQKHAHLNFFTREGGMVLSFVDYRRFGKWEPGGDWGVERGPCVLLEYPEFRENVLTNLNNSAFNKPICEALLNQKFFNGIGNYLRAEILFRCKIPPFTCARSVLEPLAENPQVKTEDPDILHLCHQLPTEVINLSGGVGYDPEADGKDYSAFSDWLQCYYNPDMKNMSDSNKRTIWFTGPAGAMVPKDTKSKRRKKSKLDKKSEESGDTGDDTVTDHPHTKPAKKTRSRIKVQAEIDQEEVKDKVEKIRTEVPKSRKAAKRKVQNTPEVVHNGLSPLKTRRQRAVQNSEKEIDNVESAHDFPTKPKSKKTRDMKSGGLMSPYFAESVSQRGRKRKSHANNFS